MKRLSKMALKQLIACVVVGGCIGGLIACTRQRASLAASGAQLALSVTDAETGGALPATQLWHETDQKICVLFGYGYNTPAAVELLLAPLIQRYGAAAQGGMILPVVFPDDFRHGTRAVAGDFYAVLDDVHLSGIILLGAPEMTYRALARMQDAYDGEQPFPIFSFFPQDDVAGMESAADFVVDRAQDTENDGVVALEMAQETEENMALLLCAAARYLVELDEPLPRDAALFSHVQAICAPHRIAHYVDPETGLRSINHFILQ
ncbi:MAG: hypothetical protein IJ191_04900 [Treponema sp.]|nr:hypothetical protein [Treponema sp.]